MGSGTTSLLPLIKSSLILTDTKTVTAAILSQQIYVNTQTVLRLSSSTADRRVKQRACCVEARNRTSSTAAGMMRCPPDVEAFFVYPTGPHCRNTLRVNKFKLSHF